MRTADFRRSRALQKQQEQLRNELKQLMREALIYERRAQVIKARLSTHDSVIAAAVAAAAAA